MADPMVRFPEALPKKPEGRVIVIGAGKASARKAETVESVWGLCGGLVCIVRRNLIEAGRVTK